MYLSFTDKTNLKGACVVSSAHHIILISSPTRSVGMCYVLIWSSKNHGEGPNVSQKLSVLLVRYLVVLAVLHYKFILILS